jgi:teichuronic acid biosynthesis glycosyltransferase TuaH
MNIGYNGMQNTNLKYDIVIVGLQPWSTSLGSNCIDMAKVFSKTCRVLYVNRASDRRTELNKWFSNSAFESSVGRNNHEYKLTQVSKNLWVLDPGIILESINLLRGRTFKYLLRFNNNKFAKRIHKAIAELNFTNFILFNDNDFFQGQFLNEALSPRLFVYYLRDYLINQPYFKRNGRNMEIDILKKADLVFTNSLYLKKYAEQYNPKSYDIGQGCTVSFPSSTGDSVMPIELQNIKAPVVGYIGNLVTLRLDLYLLEELALVRKDLYWVFVGPMDSDFSKSKLHNYSNVIFTGSKSQDQLSDYIAYFDICINPQLLNEATIGNYPRKLDEYMLFGKPIVARKTEFTQELGDLVYQYEDASEFSQMLDMALSENKFSSKREERKHLAESHTWENCVNKLFEKVVEFEKLLKS